MTMRAKVQRFRWLNRLRSLPRGLVLVVFGALLTLAQTSLQVLDAPAWVRVLAAGLVAGLAITSEFDRRQHEARQSELAGYGTLSGPALAADRLAGASHTAWQAEAARRGIATPAPVSVRWHWAAADIAPPRGEVVTAAVRGVAPGVLAGQSDRPPTAVVLESGVVTRLHDEVYARLPYGRLVILGGPGAGKTGAMILLLLQALHHREAAERPLKEGIPVPVWLTLGGWDPSRQSLREWALTVIDREHPYLRAATFGEHAAATLLDTGRLALFLDGLDEMPLRARGRALQRLDAEAANIRMVLSSRPDEYRQALKQGHLHNAAVIEMRPVRPVVATAFLMRGQVGQQRAAWGRVSDYLRQNPDTAAARALSTPLMLSLARSAYQHTDPSELVAPDGFSSPTALREHLVERVLVAAYPDESQRMAAAHWMSWIAHHMGTSRDFGWWEITTWVPRWRLQMSMASAAVGTGLLCSILGAILILIVPTQTLIDGGQLGRLEFPGTQSVLRVIVQLGVIVGVAIWWGAELLRKRTLALARPVRLNPRWPRHWEYARLVRTATVTAVGLGLGVGLLSGLAVAWSTIDQALTDGLSHVVDSSQLPAALQQSSIIGLGLGIPVGLAFGLFDVWSMPDEHVARASASASSTYSADRRARAAISVAGGGAVGLSIGAVSSALLDPAAGLVYGGIAFMAVTLLGYLELGFGASLRFTERLLEAPRLMPVLEDALEREVLRQAGSVYEFRHAELQDHLARAFQQRTGIGPVVPAEQHVSGGSFLPARRSVLAVACVILLFAALLATAASLPAMLHPDHVTLMTTRVKYLAFSPNARLLACSNGDRTELWDAETGRRLRDDLAGGAVGSGQWLMGPTAADTAFSRDGDQLATSQGSVVGWWDIPSGQLVKTMRLFAGHQAVGFSPDGKVVVSRSTETRAISLWDVASAQNTRNLFPWSLADLENRDAALVFSPDSKTFVTTGGASQRTRVWKATTGALVAELPRNLGSPTFSPDGKLLAFLEAAGVVYDTSTYHAAQLPSGRMTQIFGPRALVVAEAFYGKGIGQEPDTGGKLTLRNTITDAARTLDAPDRKLLREWLISPNGETVVTAWFETGSDAEPTDLLVWDLTRDGQPTRLGRGNRSLSSSSMAFASDGRTLATGWHDDRIRIWKLPTE
jgi:WD40 repeat protein